MSWFPCRCDHRIDDHFLAGTRRHGPCKLPACACGEFRPARKPPRKAAPPSA